MQSTALARKYRSRHFDELVGQQHVVKALTHALSTGRLHHAYLLTGTRGVGKTTIARILAKCLNCETGVTATPCGTCSACVSIEQGRFVDLLELDAASNTGVDDMREIIENARYAPTVGRYKVYLIDEVHMLSKNAFNAMLKTLEEPPEHVKFVLATTDPQKIPVTVLSRCLQFNLKQLPPDLIGEHLASVLAQESVVHDAQAVQLIARAAAGSMRDALSITDQAIAYGHGKLEAEHVRAMLGVVDGEYVLRIARALATNDGPALLAEVEGLNERGLSFDSVLQELGVLFHDIALKQSVPNAVASGAWDVSEFVDAFTPEVVQVLYQISLNGRRDLPLAPDERAGLTMALLRMLAFVPSDASALPPSLAPSGSSTVKPLRSVGPRLDVSVAPIRAAAEPNPTASAQSTSAAEREQDSAEPLRGTFEPTRDDASFAVNSKIIPAKSAEIAPQVLSGGRAAALQSPPSAKPISIDFDGDWPALVSRLPLVALTREFARNTAFVKIEGSTFYLSLADDKRPLIKHNAKLKDVLSEYFGKPIRVEVDLATIAPVKEQSAAPTLAGKEAIARDERQAQAEKEFLADPFVQTLVREMGARVHVETIRPVDDAA